MKSNNFIGFPELEWEVIFRRHVILEECGVRSNSLLLALSVLVRSFFDTENVVLKESKDSTILLFQSYYERDSYRQQMRSINDLVASDFLSYGDKKTSKFSPLQGLKILFLFLPFWYKQIDDLKICVKNKWALLLFLEKFYYLQIKLRKIICRKQYKLLVTFCDAVMEEAFVTQFFHKNNVVTASLQHGAFSAWRENTFINSGVELRCFNSDFLLCWNRMTVEEGIKEGIDEKKMPIVGILGYVNSSLNDWVNPNINVFGVVIGHESFEEENIQLIKTANIIAETYGFNYYLKLHPNYDEHYFDNMVNKKYYRGVVERGTTISKYANQVDFSIVGSSSVFVELVFINHDVIRYSTGEVTDKFRDVSIGKVISSPEQVLQLFNSKNNNNQIEDQKKLFAYLCGCKDVRGSYLHFFKQYC